MKTFVNYKVCFDNHLPMVIFASSFKDAVEFAMENINLFCCPFTGEAPVTLNDLDAVWENTPSRL